MRIRPSKPPPLACILVATDLSPRCDRALERAAQLAREWQADLTALNVLHPASSPDLAIAWAIGKTDEQALHIARQQLTRDLSGLDVQTSIRIARANDAATAIRNTAVSSGSTLVVTGLACHDAFGRFLRGSTLERLIRSLPQPLLVVRQRAHAAYCRIVVATDFSASSRHALQAAARLFPGRDLILYHACQGPLNAHPDKRSLARIGREIEEGALADFVAESTLPETTAIVPATGHGALETALTEYVRSNEIDLVVMGASGRGLVMSILRGSHTARLLHWLPCDTLIVRHGLPD